MSPKRQKALYVKDIFNKKGEYLERKREYKLPKIITTDISFQLMFGQTAPSRHDISTRNGLEEKSLIKLKYNLKI